MNFPTPLWNRLYEMADEIRELAPWKNYFEAELFAIQPRSDGPVYFVSVMGNRGEHHAIAYYPGAESLDKFRLAQLTSDQRLGIEALMLNDHLQLAFEAKKYLNPPDLEILNRLGKVYRGKWPAFRSHQPARLPWPPNLPELGDFSGLLEQTLVVLKRLAAGERLLCPFDQEEFFLRIKEGDWQDSRCRVAELPVDRHILRAELPSGALEGVQRTKAHFEIDLCLMPSPITDVPPGEPPYYPFMLIVVDSLSRMIIGFNLISTKEGVDAAMVQLPDTITKVLRNAKVIPAYIAARHPVLCSALASYCDTYGIEFGPSTSLPAADEALASAMSFMGFPAGL